MELRVLNSKGEDTGRTVSLSDSIFGIEPNNHVIYLDVKHYLANQRQGTHKSLERSEMRGSTRKLRRQKGSGAARVGDIHSPLFRGGARVFGPRPRSYGFKLNKRIKDLARRSALSYKAKNDHIVVVEDFTFDAPSTKSFLSVCDKLQISGKKSLFLLGEENKVVYLSARNLQGTHVMPYDTVNTYRILDAQVVVMTEGAVSGLHGMFGENK